jgi:hypothetical protein
MVSPTLVPISDVPEFRPQFNVRLLQRLRAERRVPSYLIGRRVFFDLADLDAYTEAQRLEVAS